VRQELRSKHSSQEAELRVPADGSSLRNRFVKETCEKAL